MELCWKLCMKITKYNRITFREAPLHFMISLYRSTNTEQFKSYNLAVTKCIIYGKTHLRTFKLATAQHIYRGKQIKMESSRAVCLNDYQ